MESERRLAEFVKLQAAAIGELTENAARQRWLYELERMPAEGFLTTVAEAASTQDAAIVYLAGLALARRSYRTEDEREHLRRSVQRAKFSIKNPQREEAADAIERTKQLRTALRELRDQMRGSKDLQRWLSRQLEFIEKRERMKNFERKSA
jgi:hypothetical protein